MDGLVNRVQQPVKRKGADQYVLLTLLSFAASVTLTRIFLELTGYPQIGGATLHIAHVLWGGLLLFVAALLPLIVTNRWAYTFGALLAGTGVGLFIDEVGKFITRTNDYFYPWAAPIIYAFFLLTLLLYLQVRRPPSSNPRATLYRALDILEEVLDRDLDPDEHTEVESMLRYVQEHADHPDWKRLASSLLDFLDADVLHLAPGRPSFWQRWRAKLHAWETRWLEQARFKLCLAASLGILGLLALLDLGRLLLAALDPMRLERMIAEVVAVGRVTTASAFGWFSARLALEGAIGLILTIGAILLVMGRERWGIGLAYLGLLLSLTAVNLMVFYFDQFSTIATAIIQFLLLLGLLHYRRRYLASPEYEE